MAHGAFPNSIALSSSKFNRPWIIPAAEASPVRIPSAICVKSNSVVALNSMPYNILAFILCIEELIEVLILSKNFSIDGSLTINALLDSIKSALECEYIVPKSSFI